jgi:hypothetical protein
MATRAWMALGGLLTTALIILLFSPVLQGFYYTFKSILELQTVFLLGTGVVIQQFASHEWSRLGLDENGRVTGDGEARSRLASLSRFYLGWSLAMAGLSTLAVGGGGLLFLRMTTGGGGGVAWQQPWIAACLAAGLQLALAPGPVILEGCNQVRQVYGFRLLRAVLERLGVWGVMLLGGGLWLFLGAQLLAVTALAIFSGGVYRRFFHSLRRTPLSSVVGWRREILPVQWRFAINWLSAYVNFSLLVPMLLAFSGPTVAGQMGITMALFSTLWAVVSPLIGTRMPAMAMAAARGEAGVMERLLWRATLRSAALLLAGCLTIWAALLGLDAAGWALARRFLAPLPAGAFGLATVFFHLRFAMTTYARVHKQEPFWTLGLLEMALVALVLPYLALVAGVGGMAAGFLGISLAVTAVAAVVFVRYRRGWLAAIAGSRES